MVWKAGEPIEYAIQALPRSVRGYTQIRKDNLRSRTGGVVLVEYTG